MSEQGITESYPRIEAGDTFRFEKVVTTKANSAAVSIWNPSGTLVTSLSVALWDVTSPKQLRSYTTGSGSLSVTVNPNAKFSLDEVRLNVDVTPVTSGAFKINLDANEGAAFDLNFLTQNMVTVQDLWWTPDNETTYVKGDKVIFTWANSDSGTYGLEVLYSLLEFRLHHSQYEFNYTIPTSYYTTVLSSGIHIIEWTLFRDTGNDKEKEYFEVIKTD